MDSIELFKKAAVALQTDERYLALDAARKASDQDEELQKMIGEFNLARLDLNNEIGKDDRDEEKLASLNDKINKLYADIMANDKMVAYNEAKAGVEALIGHIDAIINTAMNGGDPMTVEAPQQGCTGSCSSCGGCH